MFEYAARNKLRFSYKGQLSVEDLWDLRVEELDAIYREIGKRMNDAAGESLLASTMPSRDDVVRRDILRHIVQTKQDEAAERAKRAERAAKRRTILSALAAKEEDALRSATPEALRQMLDDLDD